MAARLALLSNGWTVAKPDTDEAFDIVARDPLTGEWKTFQVKTIRQRLDRGGDLVITAKKSSGDPYTQADADYLVGVWETEAGPRVFMTENRGIGEYWASEARAAERWVELPIDFNREILSEGSAECAALT